MTRLGPLCVATPASAAAAPRAFGTQRTWLTSPARNRSDDSASALFFPSASIGKFLADAVDQTPDFRHSCLMTREVLYQSDSIRISHDTIEAGDTTYAMHAVTAVHHRKLSPDVSSGTLQFVTGGAFLVVGLGVATVLAMTGNPTDFMYFSLDQARFPSVPSATAIGVFISGIAVAVVGTLGGIAVLWLGLRRGRSARPRYQVEVEIAGEAKEIIVTPDSALAETVATALKMGVAGPN